MNEYHKIQSIFKRNMTNNSKALIEGDWAIPEFGYLARNIWTFTEKVDGTNIRIIFKNGCLTIGGKTDEAQIPTQLANVLNKRFAALFPKITELFPNGVVLCGEGYGAKIQKGGGNYRADQDFVLFDIRVEDLWLQRESVYHIAKDLGLDVVPVIGEGTLYDAIALTRKGIRSEWGDFKAEGIVARPKTEMNTRTGFRIITKTKCKDVYASLKEE